MVVEFNSTGGAALLNKMPIRVILVDDYEPWRVFLSTTLRNKQELQLIGEVSDGLEAVRIAEQLRPDLILLDIGLPGLNGIEAARQIRKVSPASKILFVSESRSPDIVEEALSTGAGGFVAKSDAGSDLVPAVEAVLQGKRFLSITVTGHDSSIPMKAAITYSHEVAVYHDDSSVVEGYARFIESSLKRGNVVIVIVTDSHRARLLPKLEADGVDVPGAIEQGRYIPLNIVDTLSRLVVNDMPDPVRCMKVVRDLIMGAAKGLQGANRRVAVCGEIAPMLLSKGNAEGAIKLERLWDEITRGYGIHTLCAYLSSAFPHQEADPVFQRICAEHSAVHGPELDEPR
jgi:DNA-binding NarL/FixJ family response regulator